MDFVQNLDPEDWQHLFQVGFFVVSVLLILFTGTGAFLLFRWLSSGSTNEGKRLGIEEEKLKLDYRRMEMEARNRDGINRLLARLVQGQEALEKEHELQRETSGRALNLLQRALDQNNVLDGKMLDALSIISTDLKGQVDSHDQRAMDFISAATQNDQTMLETLSRIDGRGEEIKAALSNVAQVLEGKFGELSQQLQGREAEWRKEGEFLNTAQTSLLQIEEMLKPVLNYIQVQNNVKTEPTGA